MTELAEHARSLEAVHWHAGSRLSLAQVTEINCELREQQIELTKDRLRILDLHLGQLRQFLDEETPSRPQRRYRSFGFGA